ncbi:MAG: LamG domain-containing protein [Candidatus Schekmanbacteria bacterium]|nr:MAG: LamG domain-containing protein [Candidatus Schekmanbacteria bacterium]
MKKILYLLTICICIICFQNKADALPITSGLIAYWTGNSITNDSSVNNNNGTLQGGTTYAPGIIGEAFSFDGINDYVSVADNPLWTFSGDFTINLWANLSSIPSSSIGQPDSVFIGHDNGGGYQNKWFFALGGGKLNFHINGPGAGGSAFLAQTPFSPALGEWNNLSVVKSGSTYTIYINGIEGNSQTSSLVIPDATVPLTIGQAEGFFTEGLIDEIAIYDRALSQTEIAALASVAAVPEPETSFLFALGSILLGIVGYKKN